MLDAQGLKTDNMPEFDPDGEIIELTQIVEEESLLNDVIELTDPVTNGESSEPITEIPLERGNAFSEDQIRGVLEKIVEERYAHRMDALLSDMIQKAVESRMEKIKECLLKSLAEK